MTRTLATLAILGLGFVFGLACDETNEGSSVDDECDANLRPVPGVDYSAEVCKAVGLISDCLALTGTEAEQFSDDELREMIDSCAAEFNFCHDPGDGGVAEGTTFSELRGQSNMCIG